ncbi:MAG TPA: type II toxin-antitoxin system RelE/ParE family toxin [Tepidisphaeraceae bacterium]|nr:type II toxin-antitoxin system RelE/ParE family toxin [Tepidisphaeraceae bacterium]
MKYRVELTENAQREAAAAYDWHAERNARAAAWFSGVVDAIEGLSEMPTRWGLARESAEFDEPVRQLLYGRSPHVYRVLFISRSDVVFVVRVRHGARRTLLRSEVMLPPVGGTGA